MGRREEHNWLLSVKGAEQGEAHVWVGTRGDLTLPQVPGTARNPHVQILPGLGAGLSSSLHKSLRGKTKKTDISLIMRKNDTQEAFQTFLQYGLSFKSNEREMNTENSGCATKKRHTPEQNPELKRHYKGIFSHTELIKWPLCFQSPENH